MHNRSYAKKENLSACSNWRGITLLSAPGKILSNIIYERIKNEVQSAMREDQAGFREGRVSVYQHYLRKLIRSLSEN